MDAAAFSIALPPRVYTDSMRRVAFFDNLTRQLRSVPGVQSAAAMTGLPPLRQVNANDTQFEDYTLQPGAPPTTSTTSSTPRRDTSAPWEFP